MSEMVHAAVAGDVHEAEEIEEPETGEEESEEMASAAEPIEQKPR